MNLDIRDFLDRNNIFYRDHGTGVKKGNVVIKCPYCGADDRGEHLGISLSNGVWGCWRNDTHRGKDLARLITKLIPITYTQARKLIGVDTKAVEIDTFDEIASDGYFNNINKKIKSNIKSLLIPKEFRMLDIKSSAARPYVGYLASRGFDNVREMVHIYNIRYAITGDYKSRIILPIYFNNQLVTWTSRAISKNALLRYFSLSAKYSSINIKDTIYNFDRANEGGKVLFVTEGPFDALKVDYYLMGMPAHAVGLFSMTISDDQLYWLIELFDKYETVVLLLDSGEIDSIEKGLAKLSSTGKVIEEGILPRSVLDPGELKRYQVKNLYKKWRGGHGNKKEDKTENK